MDLDEIIATGLEFGFGLWLLSSGIVSVCVPSLIKDRQDSLAYRVMARSNKMATRQDPERSLSASQIRFWGIIYLIGGVLALTDATIRVVLAAHQTLW